MSVKWNERRFSKSLLLDEQKVTTSRWDPLEELVSCPIHLGLLERPIQLPCGHSFCLKCIEYCLASQTPFNCRFPCPICRTECPIPTNGAAGWPSSYVLNDIIEYINKRQGIFCSENSSNDVSQKRRDSIIAKADIVKKFASEIACRQKNNESLDKAYFVEQLNNIMKTLQDSAGGRLGSCRRRSSLEMKAEIEETRRQMNWFCVYDSRKESLPLDIVKEMKESPFKDCVDADDDSQYRKIIFVNVNKDIVIYDCNKQKSNRFALAFESDVLKPVYLKLFHDCVYVSAVYVSNEDSSILWGIVVKYSIDGLFIDNSQKFAKQNGEELPVYGFDITVDGRVRLALPDLSAVYVLRPDLQEIIDKFVFSQPDLHPRFLSCSSSTNEVWVSCPADQTVLILDESVGSYMKFGTAQLFNSEPSHITSTSDNRICFLDSKMSRVFWVKRKDQYLCIQRLAFGHSVKNIYFKTIRGFILTDLLFITTENAAFFASPKLSSHSKPNANCCVLM